MDATHSTDTNQSKTKICKILLYYRNSELNKGNKLKIFKGCIKPIMISPPPKSTCKFSKTRTHVQITMVEKVENYEIL